MFRGNVFVLKSLRFVKRPLQDSVQRLSHVLLCETLHFRKPCDLALDFLCQCFRANSQPRQQWRHYAVCLRHQRFQQMHRLNLLVFVACRQVVCLLQRFLRLHGHLVKSQHVYLASQRKGASALASPCPSTALLLAYFAPAAAAATAGVPALTPTFTLICFGFASSRFGIVSVSTPFR